MEHRLGLRRSMLMQVTVRTRNGIAAEGWIRDISSSGARLQSHLPVPLNSTVLVRFKNAGCLQQTPSRAVWAEIVRHTRTGFAVEWTEFSPLAIRAILRHYAMKTAYGTQPAVGGVSGRENEPRRQPADVG